MTLIKLWMPALLLVPVWGLAQDLKSPVGRWKTFAEKDGALKSLVRIEESEGHMVGYVEKIYPRPGEPENPLCKACPGDLKDKPIIGLKFLWGFKPAGGAQFKDGQILDPENGKIYDCKMELLDEGKSLKVRGYIGLSLFGRSQTWSRENSPPQR